MSPFTGKDWIDGTTHEIQGPSTTPISAAALEDLEIRLSDYTDAHGPAYSVIDYGATGDGTTDDTTAIQAGIDALAATTRGGILFFPAGAYAFSSLEMKEKVCLTGVGGWAGSVLTRLAGSTGPGIVDASGLVTWLGAAQFRGLYFDGNDTKGDLFDLGYSSGIQWATQAWMKNCVIKNVYQGRDATTLNGGITDVQTTITLTNASAFPTSGRVAISNNTTATIREYVNYTGKSGNDLTGCERGVMGTTAEAHNNGVAVEVGPFVGLAARCNVVQLDHVYIEECGLGAAFATACVYAHMLVLQGADLGFLSTDGLLNSAFFATHLEVPGGFAGHSLLNFKNSGPLTFSHCDATITPAAVPEFIRITGTDYGTTFTGLVAYSNTPTSWINKDGTDRILGSEAGANLPHYSGSGLHAHAGPWSFTNYQEASTGIKNGTLFVDSADGKLKFKDGTGTVQSLY